MAETRELRLIAFRVGEETFLIDIMAVRQIVIYTGSTPIPAAPDFVEGIIVLRGEVVPIIDLRERFGVEGVQKRAKEFVLITDTSAGPIGLKVDEVRRIVNVSSDALMEPPDVVRSVRRDFLIAVVKQRDDVYLLMDIESILTPDEKTRLQSAELSSSEATGKSAR